MAVYIWTSLHCLSRRRHGFLVFLLKSLFWSYQKRRLWSKDWSIDDPSMLHFLVKFFMKIWIDGWLLDSVPNSSCPTDLTTLLDRHRIRIKTVIRTTKRHRAFRSNSPKSWDFLSSFIVLLFCNCFEKSKKKLLKSSCIVMLQSRDPLMTGSIGNYVMGCFQNGNTLLFFLLQNVLIVRLWVKPTTSTWRNWGKVTSATKAFAMWYSDIHLNLFFLDMWYICLVLSTALIINAGDGIGVLMPNDLLTCSSKNVLPVSLPFGQVMHLAIFEIECGFIWSWIC